MHNISVRTRGPRGSRHGATDGGALSCTLGGNTQDLHGSPPKGLVPGILISRRQLCDLILSSMDADRIEHLKALPVTEWPYTVARSPSSSSAGDKLLHALLVLDHDEISDTDDCEGVERYLISAGRRKKPHLDRNGRVHRSVIFWLYPTGRWGHYRRVRDEETGEERLEKHGLLITVEEGALIQDVVQRAREGLVMGELRHEHVAARWDVT
ncbi:hypothetical protein EXIGLDRAFT_366375 [Exidia glandulosa HHB12029]|uniref:Uncharacterized protein n=1 Tax=Exidia glandulosa HHB12029 TaxID=1314781 RepID=A0A165L6S8_EXIGL|nr:hypothetical protein EXIGLDRAFT_366375 [Exidia glandulosa HHB12029]